MKSKSIIAIIVMAQLSAGAISYSAHVTAQENAVIAQPAVEKGPNNGRMLRQNNFAIELAIFEDGVEPQFRVFASIDGKKIQAKDVDLNVKLTRLGNVIDDINFVATGAYATGDMTIYEPHSFVVTLTAKYQGKAYQWSYDNFEGRTAIESDIAKSMQIETNVVGSKVMTEQLKVFGQLQLAPNAKREISARFSGEITKLAVTLGQRVKKGQLLMSIESNESLQTYHVYSPINGLVTAQHARLGEQTRQRTLLTLSDPSQLVAQFSVYPMDQARVKLGDSIRISVPGLNDVVESTLSDSLVEINQHQAKVYLANIDNSDGQFSVGQFITGNILTAAYKVPLAVNTQALQAFRDFTVVYTKIGQQYEVRMLTLGRRAGDWVEVLGGINAGSEYVAKNSYVVKADIDKSSASHDH